VARTTDIDWIAIARRLLIDEGPTALTLERLCAVAQRTRGSLYHHYAGLPALKAELLSRWAREHTDALIHATEALGGPGEQKRRRLDALALALDMRTEQAMRSWAAYDPEVRAVVHDMDQRRIDYLVALELECGESSARARQLALLQYALFLGYQQLPGEAERAELNQTAATLRFDF
jgi:AcrR family transcriptional regulator